MKRIDITGQKFSRLMVIAEAGYHTKQNGQKTLKWLCKCDCGNEHIVIGSKLKNGHTKSCGCLKIETTKSGARRSHGMNRTVEYEAWCGMIKRCTNPNYSGFSNYGGRGITICERWLDFKAFYDDMGDRPDNTSLDRVDVNGNYEPSNCRWATPKEQCRNRRNNRLIEYKCEVKCVTEWAELTGIPAHKLRVRFDAGWSSDQVFDLLMPQQHPETRSRL